MSPMYCGLDSYPCDLRPCLKFHDPAHIRKATLTSGRSSDKWEIGSEYIRTVLFKMALSVTHHSTMSDPIPPPQYDQQDHTHDAPPSYTFPSSFVIGSRPTQRLLVSTDQLKGHLGLLREFKALRVRVDGSDVSLVDSRLPQWAAKLDKEARWSWFVGLAVER